MSTDTKPKTATKNLTSVKKSNTVRPNMAQPYGKPKIVLGTGRHLAFVSDNLFDDDLKQ